MMPFGEYAKYYDLLYADKDYAAESAFVGEIIQRHAPGARLLLELGCGSARHGDFNWPGKCAAAGEGISADLGRRA